MQSSLIPLEFSVPFTERWSCWWKKSCTTQHAWNLVNNGIFTISQDFFHQQFPSPIWVPPSNHQIGFTQRMAGNETKQRSKRWGGDFTCPFRLRLDSTRIHGCGHVETSPGWFFLWGYKGESFSYTRISLECTKNTLSQVVFSCF